MHAAAILTFVAFKGARAEDGDDAIAMAGLALTLIVLAPFVWTLGAVIATGWLTIYTLIGIGRLAAASTRRIGLRQN
jgi:hypothetical protein